MFNKMYIKSVFKHYINKKMLKLGLGNASVPSFHGERKHLTVLFSDIFSFIYYLVKQLPEETVSNLGEYFTEMVDVILRYGGLVDKFRGGDMMVEFGVPIHFPDHAERACLAALEMVRSFDRLRERWMQEGKEVFDIKIGINTGDMIVGNIGSKHIFDYTVIGGAVAFGVRLRDINQIYPTANHIVISEFTKNELSDEIVTRELDTVRVKGWNKPVAIFELIGEKDYFTYPDEYLPHFNEGIAKYKNQEWDRALSEFKKALNFKEDDLSKMYIKRCKHFKKYSPGTEWDGVFMLRIGGT